MANRSGRTSSIRTSSAFDAYCIKVREPAVGGLSPPTFHQRNDASTQHGDNDDGGKRLHRGEGLVPVVPKLKHSPMSIESPPTTFRLHAVERTCLCDRKY